MSQELAPDIAGIHSAFAETEYGRRAAESIRYERYNLEGSSHEEWVALLGPDVNGLTHGPLTRQLAKSFIRHSQYLQPGLLNDSEEMLLEVTAIAHDWGEAIKGIGDTTYSDNTDEKKNKEKAELLANLDSFYEGGTDDVRELILTGIQEVAFNSGGNEKLARVFNAIERVGYVRTALRAAEVINSGQYPEHDAGLRWLIADVFANQIAKLDEYAGDYAVVDLYLINQHHVISEAFKMIGYEEFLNYENETQRSQKIKEFCDAQGVWFERASRLRKLRKI
jgi:hypothetical protein